MNAQRTESIAYAKKSAEKQLQSLMEFLRIPSISTDPEHNQDMERAADWVMERLRALGMENVRKFPTQRHPIVYGEYLKASGAPIVLVYGHYDVQPVDPLEQWNSAPFEPTQAGANLFARGASDMKGQIAAVLNALEAIRSNGNLPVNFKWLIEGEEEIGSPNLVPFIKEHGKHITQVEGTFYAVLETRIEKMNRPERVAAKRTGEERTPTPFPLT